MTDKPCSKCGINPRKISSRGQQLTMCADCQRAQWRQYKPAKKPPMPVKKPPRQPEPPAPTPTPEPPKKAASRVRAEKLQTQLQIELIATRYELRKLRRMIATASSLDEIRKQVKS